MLRDDETATIAGQAELAEPSGIFLVIPSAFVRACFNLNRPE